MIIDIFTKKFTLHQSGAMFWQEKKILFISDVHFGKVAHFRKHGIGIPEEAIMANFNRLNSVLELFDTEIIIFLGDLFHSKINNEWNLFANWIKNLTQQVILIEGNHDVIAKHLYAELNIKIYRELVLPPFLLTHHPTDKEGFFNFCGHIHPAIKLKGMGRQFLGLSCFFRKPNQLIFPAFGEFTGTFYLNPTEKDHVYAITENEVIEINLS